MTVLHEARELYDAANDSVGRLTLTVEHAPGQLAAIVQFLGGIGAQAGVYFAEIEHEVMDPPAPVAEPEVQEETKGEGYGESTVQRDDQQPEAAEVGEGREPEETGAGAGLDQHEDSAVAGPAGEGAVEGPGEQDA